MEIVLTTNEKRLIFTIHSTDGLTRVGVYTQDRKASEKLQPLGSVEFAELVRMAKAILGTVP